MPSVDRAFQCGEIHLGYQLFVPDSYSDAAKGPFPLILFLHGIRKRGSDLRLLDDYGLLDIAVRDGSFPYIVVAPQCPADTAWPEHRSTIEALLREVMDEERVDPGRVYATGFSMGGHGVWDLAVHTNGLFAAFVPLAGWYEPAAAPRLQAVPVWAFHGDEDDTVPVQRAEELVQAIRASGGSLRFTKYSGLKHQIMEATYTDPDLYEWLEEHKLGSGT